MQKSFVTAAILSLLLAGNTAVAATSFDSTPSATDKPLILRVVPQQITVNGKKSQVFNIIKPNGQAGFFGKKGQYFNVLLENKTSQPLTIHWHGLLLPNSQDGIPFVTQLPIPPGGKFHYDYRLIQSGTYWMHSHYGFQEQQMMSAPFIIENPDSRYKNAKNIVVMMEDFSFTPPQQIFADLRHRGSHADMAKMDMKGPDLNDVTYDAYLTNRHTLNHPDIIMVKPGEQIRLHIINASSATNLWIKTGKLETAAISFDGQPIKPYKNEIFQLPMSDRIDLLATAFDESKKNAPSLKKAVLFR